MALYVLDTAAIGGSSLIASSWAVYNDIAKNRPDMIAELASKEWVHNT